MKSRNAIVRFLFKWIIYFIDAHKDGVCLYYKQRNNCLGFFSKVLQSQTFKTNETITHQSNFRKDLNTQLQLVEVSLVLPGLSYPNFCYSAFCWATHRSTDCQHLETLTLTGATESCTHTFQRGPDGAGNRKWSNLPQPVSELWFIHTRVSGNRCGKTEWKRKRGEVGEEDNIYSSVSTVSLNEVAIESRDTQSPIPLLAKLRLCL